MFTTLQGTPPAYLSTGVAAPISDLADIGGMAIDPSGTLYVASFGNIYTVSPQGAINPINAIGLNSSAQDLAIDGAGNIYVTTNRFYVFKVSPSGLVSTIAGNGTNSFQPNGIAVDSAGDVFISDIASQTILKISTSGVTTTFAGTPNVVGFADGAGDSAKFNFPGRLAIDSLDNLFVADSGNSAIRKVTPAGQVTTFASDKFGPQFGYVSGVAIDSAGNVFVADSYYQQIFKITIGGVVSICGGTKLAQGTANGVGISAQFNSPNSIEVDGAGDLYIGDNVNESIRRGVPTAVNATAVAGFAISQVSVLEPGLPFTITVTAVNSFGVPETSYSGTIHFTCDDLTAVLPPDTALVNGVGTFTVTLNAPGLIELTAADVQNSAIAGYYLFTDEAETYTQTISYSQPADVLTDAAPFRLSVTASSGLTPVLTVVSGPATVNGMTVTLTGAPGTVTIQASQPGNSAYAPAQPVNIVFDVDAAGVSPSIIAQPVTESANAGSAAAFWVQATGTPPLTYQWTLNGTPIAGATSASLLVSNVQASNAGSYAVTVSNMSGYVLSVAATLAVNSSITVQAPTVAEQPQPQTVENGGTVVFTVGTGTSAGTTSLNPSRVATRAQTVSTLTYQWFLDGAPVAGATNSTLIIYGATASNSGSYTCIVSDLGGAVETTAAQLSIVSSANPGRLTNLSCRAQVGTGGNVIIAGFVVGGAGTSGNESVLVRGSGPALGLTPFDLAGVLPDPLLTFTNVSDNPNVVLATNQGWGGAVTIANAAAQVGAFSWGSLATADSAVAESLPSANYTAQISGANGDTGVALVEIYDATAAGTYTASSPRLINLSARVHVGTGANTAFTGFVIGGSTAKTILIRASGPALSQAPFNLAGTLPDPQLTLTNVTATPNVVLTSNIGWGGDSVINSVAGSVGAFQWSLTGNDSALLVTLPPGNYTAGVQGASGDSGIALIELYEVP